ncbi:molybdopterin molybdotransferase MoeA [Streptomyces sp. NBC_00102]|uniref:molybdopterin molybdotransferase MoeA n=1 Tax=Streptomyces sp. NBC_00102 TaxID=2975652 RepID=UPI0022585A53|nr:molybdopterin-binding protein [Streptomyces sp. NBC_00102]MCX5398340.1 molybdopterin-binding protein [Streptomyces sp. NBC_00102]
MTGREPLPASEAPTVRIHRPGAPEDLFVLPELDDCPVPVRKTSSAEDERAVEQALALANRFPPHETSRHDVAPPVGGERAGRSEGPASPDTAKAAAPAPAQSVRDRDRTAAPAHHSPVTSWERARALAARAGRRSSQAAIRLPLDRSPGHVLAEGLVALTDLPSFDTSAMDGWAVTGPGPWHFREGSGLLAGDGGLGRLPDGEAVRIATGARMPAEATAVIRSEHAEVDEAKGMLHARRAVVPGQDIRPRAQECRTGEHLLAPGTLVTPAVLGLAAAAGYDALVVVPRPRVEVLVLGDELLTSGLPHGGRIRDALGPMLGPWLRAAGADLADPRCLGDDPEALRHALTTTDADLVLTTGGTAAGPVDHVHPILSAIGAELLVDGVAVRPGHPMLLARLAPDGPCLVGLPGNPLAAVSGLLTLALPLLGGLAGRVAPEPYRALVQDAVQGHPHDTRLVPVAHRSGRGGGRDRVVPLRYNGPAMLRGIATADGMAVVPPGGVRPGAEVEILDLPWA